MGAGLRAQEREGLVNIPRPSPMDVLKWSAVIFGVCLEILVVIAIVLAMFGIY
jgi:hypothetical protein